MKHIIALATLTLACTACGGGDEDKPEAIIDQNLQGNIQGEPWEFVSGYADEGFEAGELYIQLYGVEAVGGDPCGPGAYSIDEPSIGFSVTPEPQEREFSFDDAGVFSTYKDDTFYLDPILSGRLILDEVTSEMISGSMVGSTPESEVNGHFTVIVCPTE